MQDHGYITSTTVARQHGQLQELRITWRFFISVSGTATRRVFEEFSPRGLNAYWRDGVRNELDDKE